MKAAVYAGIQKIRFEERPIPQTGPDEAVIKIKYCGICGTDMHIYWHGDPIVKPGIVLGHENVGIIHQVGKNVTGYKGGDRVVAGPPDPCGECYYCQHDHSNICVRGFANTNGLGRDGGMAEYMLIHDPRGMLFHIPDNVSFEEAVLTDTIATACRGIGQSAFKMNDNCVVSGAGAIGLSAIQLLKIGGARHITALDIVPERRQLALRLGADVALDPVAEGNNLIAKIAGIYDGIGADFVVEASGSPASFETCMQLCRSGGQILNLGIATEPARVSQSLLVVHELNIKSSMAYTRNEVNIVLYYMAKSKIDIKGIFSGSIPLENLVKHGFNRLQKDKTYIKLAVAP